MIKGIKFYTFAGSSSGYGRAGQAYICGLLDQGIKISWQPMLWDVSIHKYRSYTAAEIEAWTNDGWRDPLAACFYLDIDYSHIVLQVVPEYWPALVEADKVNIGYTTWEADKLPAHWPELLPCVDRIAVPSQFNKLVFEKGLEDTPVYTVPHAIESRIMPSPDQLDAFVKTYDIDTSQTVFYTLNTWTVRKAMDQLIRVFCSAFLNKEPVTLVIKTSDVGVRYPGSIKRESTQSIFADLLEDLGHPVKIVLIASEELQEWELDALHCIGDCYVSFTHGEGWGMGAAEAAWHANPVLITGWSGVLEFLGQDYPGLISSQLMPAVDLMGYPSVSPDQKWAMVNQTDAISLMQDVYQNLDKWKAIATEHKKTLENFSITAVTDKLLKVIDV